MHNTPEKIRDSAQQCFFQFGFSKTSLTMIAEQAGVSRVTLYKYFKTKEELFHAVVESFIRARVAETMELMQTETDYWKRLEHVFLDWVVSPLEAIASDLVISDLMYAVRRTGDDYYNTWTNELRDILKSITQDAVDSGQIDPGRYGRSSGELAQILSIMIMGLKDGSVSEIRRGFADITGFLKAILQTP